MTSDYLILIVEVAVTVFVFLLGLPILVNQIFLPDDLRRMSRKNYTMNIMWGLIPLAAMLLLILVVAFPAKTFFLADSREQWIFWKEILVTVLFVIMLAFTLRFLLSHLIKTQGYRAKIIEVIQQKAIEGFRKTGKLERAYLDDLEYLGVYSKPGAETTTVIEALENLLMAVAEEGQPENNGDSLILLIEILCNAVANSVEPGSRSNMVDVLTIYKGVLMDLDSRSTEEAPLIYGNETRKIKDCTTKIALVSLKRAYADMMPLVLNVLTLIPRSSDRLFDIGLLALGNEQYQIATNVLAEVMDRDNLDYLTMNNYLGLAAHFYYCGGAARRYALRSMEKNKLAVTQEALKIAMEYHYIMSNFKTVDQIEGMMEGVFPAYLEDKEKEEPKSREKA